MTQNVAKRDAAAVSFEESQASGLKKPPLCLRLVSLFPSVASEAEIIAAVQGVTHPGQFALYRGVFSREGANRIGKSIEHRSAYGITWSWRPFYATKTR